MADGSLQVRTMIRNYGRQLASARRLARFRRALVMAGMEDEVSLSRQAKRRHLVERISREVVENLLVSDSDNPVVTEIKQRLEEEFGERLEFAYPPAEPDMRIFRTPEKGSKEIVGEEKGRIMSRLWHITLETVDETML